MRRIALATLPLLLLAIPAGASTSNHRGCGNYHGRDYVICKESGRHNMPNGLPPGYQHPGKSSASGPCGMLRKTRAAFGGDTLAACARYMSKRYGSWTAAEAHHRRKNWW
jgi:hypothetical protein